jgi:hypothetical protein
MRIRPRWINLCTDTIPIGTDRIEPLSTYVKDT